MGSGWGARHQRLAGKSISQRQCSGLSTGLRLTRNALCADVCCWRPGLQHPRGERCLCNLLPIFIGKMGGRFSEPGRPHSTLVLRSRRFGVEPALEKREKESTTWILATREIDTDGTQRTGVFDITDQRSRFIVACFPGQSEAAIRFILE